jgi:hypothetical protein
MDFCIRQRSIYSPTEETDEIDSYIGRYLGQPQVEKIGRECKRCRDLGSWAAAEQVSQDRQ